MALLLISFLAGVLTILTPCSFTLLPVILGSGLQNEKNRFRPYIIVLSLALSILIFSILLKATTLLIQIPLEFWSIVSGTLLILLSFSYLFPTQWSEVMIKLRFQSKSEKVLDTSMRKGGNASAIVSGLALGPIFSGCSPTYLAIVSVLLPANFSTGILYLLSYCLGLSLILFLVILGGQGIIKKFKWAVNPSGNFRKTLGVILLLIGILIFFRIDKQIEASLINTDFTESLIKFENGFLKEEL